MTKYAEIIDSYPALRKRLDEHQRMHAALLEIKRHFENDKGKFIEAYPKAEYPGEVRHIYNIACRGLEK